MFCSKIQICSVKMFAFKFTKIFAHVTNVYHSTSFQILHNKHEKGGKIMMVEIDPPLFRYSDENG